ncbi:MAG: hypothetical protein ABJ311_02340 [Erythrobacter sp.]
MFDTKTGGNIMRAYPIAAAAVLALAAPTYAQSQEEASGSGEEALAEMSEKLADPEFQEETAAIAQVFVTAMLDLKVGPLAEAMDRATNGRGPDVDPDATLRDLAPEADEIPDQVAQNLPQAMDAMSAMADGMQTMLPALRDMAEQMRDAIENAR